MSREVDAGCGRRGRHDCRPSLWSIQGRPDFWHRWPTKRSRSNEFRRRRRWTAGRESNGKAPAGSNSISDSVFFFLGGGFQLRNVIICRVFFLQIRGNLPMGFDRERGRNDGRSMAKCIQIRARKRPSIHRRFHLGVDAMARLHHPSQGQIRWWWWSMAPDVENPGASPSLAKRFALRTARSVWLASSGCDSIHRTNHPPVFVFKKKDEIY